MPIQVDAAAMRARLEELAALATSGAAAGSVAAAEAVQQVVGHKLTERSHEKGTPTPSPRGEPPAKITGDLAGSFVVHPGLGPLGLEAELSSDLVYSAIHEHGGTTGRGHATQLPARPYLKPAMDESYELVLAAYLSRWLI